MGLLMLVVAIVLPTADNVTDVRFGVILVTGSYDQPWECCSKSVPVFDEEREIEDSLYV